MHIRTQIHIISRAIHTLEHLRNNGRIAQDESISTLFAEHSWEELHALRTALLAESGMQAQDIDLGASMVFIEAA